MSFRGGDVFDALVHLVVLEVDVDVTIDSPFDSPSMTSSPGWLRGRAAYTLSVQSTARSSRISRRLGRGSARCPDEDELLRRLRRHPGSRLSDAVQGSLRAECVERSVFDTLADNAQLMWLGAPSGQTPTSLPLLREPPERSAFYPVQPLLAVLSPDDPPPGSYPSQTRCQGPQHEWISRPITQRKNLAQPARSRQPLIADSPRPLGAALYLMLITWSSITTQRRHNEPQTMMPRRPNPG